MPENKQIGNRVKQASFSDFFKRPYGIATTIAGGLLLVLIIFSAVMLWGYHNAYPGISIEGLDVGGKSQSEIHKMLEEEMSNRKIEQTLDMSINEKSYELKVNELGAEYDFQKTAENAYNYAREGNIFARIGKIVGAFFGGVQQKCVVTANEETMRAKMDEIIADIGQEVIQPTYKIEDGKITIDRGQSGILIENRVLTNLVFEQMSNGEYNKVEYKAEIEEPNAVNLEEIHNAVAGETRNAILDLAADPLGNKIMPSTIGADFNIDEAKKALENSDERFVEISAQVVTPKVTTEELKQKLFRDTISTYSTKFNAGLTNRTKNVALAAKNINGKILNPGDVFSYNKTVGPRTYDRGFVDATIFNNGTTEDGVGGGICQVSSNLYLSVLKADLKIVERHNHTLAVAYVPVGQDATVVYGNKDFQFKNDTDYPIKIQAYTKGSTLTISLIGTKTENKKVEMVTSVLSKNPFEVVEIDDASVPAGTKKVKNNGFTGYKTSTYRVVYIDGVEKSRTHENNSNYKRVDKVILVGPKQTVEPIPTPDPIPTPTPDPIPQPEPQPEPEPEVTPQP